MPGFEDAWAAVAAPHNGEPVTPELKPLLRRLYDAVLTSPVNRRELKASLIQVFEYLSGAGRTNPNCWAVDLFFCTSDGWERDWTDQELPDDFHELMSLTGQALHDSVKSPEIAGNFDCLPEQLLERARRLTV